MKIRDGMMMEPYLKKIHKNLSTGCIGFEQLISLDFPLFTKLIRNFFHENRVLIESTLIFFIIKKREIRIIKNLIFFFPNEVVSGLLSWK
jgi:hypothetical protein